ncbi:MULTISPECIES: AbiJ-NTD4 domain-containing protein [Hyphomicrobiales]|jgi:hypothetical protein|uniref:AbiJ-NTD4 domain-containing protein n=1 Tax=Hyphomicrobiales TaxID=356 RepID=UPI0007DA788B|nr:hypothetical protein [Shinella sp. HZN7]ANH05796.1 hypothetical protein shn_18340 [Shinella sp. HZN7]
MVESGSSFSERFGYRAPDAEITIREDAPEVLRVGVTQLAYGAGLSAKGLREIVCAVLLKRPDPNNWSPENVAREVDDLVSEAPWYEIYDLAERLHEQIGRQDYSGTLQTDFARRLDRLFREHGIGWQFEDGRIVVRGSEAFALATRDAVETMRVAGTPTAANEVHEALRDISRRPEADVTGAIQHAMAALECVAREIDSSNDTLGSIINRLPLPAPLDGALHRLWGFASQQGRHIQEGRAPLFAEAELVVTVASAVSVYLLRHRARSQSPIIV